MRKSYPFLGALLLAMFSACDDGDITYQDIDFSKTTNVSRCTNPGTEKIFYKLQDSEALILVLDADQVMQDPDVQTSTVAIDGSTTMLDYRQFSGKVETANICNLPSPPSPVVTKSITASPGGSVVIDRNVAINNNDDNTNVSLTYQYTFTLHNINFQDGDFNVKYDNMLFGTTNYATRTLQLNFQNRDNTLKTYQTCNDKYFVLANSEVMFLDLKAEDFPTDATTEPKLIALNDTKKAHYKLYSRAGLNATDVCTYNEDIPGTSAATITRLIERWIATEGSIQITSRWTAPVAGDPILVHEIALVQVKFTKEDFDNLNFTKSSIPFGTSIDLNNN